MRLRNWRASNRQVNEQSTAEQATVESATVEPTVKSAEPVRLNPILNTMRGLLANPDFPIQLAIVILTVSSNHIRMDRRIDSMNTTVETVRGITNLLTNSMELLKNAADTPQQIRRMLK